MTNQPPPWPPPASSAPTFFLQEPGFPSAIGWAYVATAIRPRAGRPVAPSLDAEPAGAPQTRFLMVTIRILISDAGASPDPSGTWQARSDGRRDRGVGAIRGRPHYHRFKIAPGADLRRFWRYFNAAPACLAGPAGLGYSAAMTAALVPGCADALLFDLGRVVIDIDFDRVLAVWADQAGCAAADLAPRFVLDEAYRRHERGEIDDAAFFAGLRDRLGVALTDAQLLEGWNAIFVGEMPGIEAQLARAGKRLPLYALSNTNPPHVAHFSRAYADVLRHFRAVFVSSEIGCRKPDPAAYDHVVATHRHRRAADRVLR